MHARKMCFYDSFLSACRRTETAAAESRVHSDPVYQLSGP